MSDRLLEAGSRERQRFRFREYRLVPDHEPDAEPPLFAAQCCVCEAASPLAEDPEQAASWAIGHLQRSREHFTYRSLVASPVRAEPGGWLPTAPSRATRGSDKPCEHRETAKRLGKTYCQNCERQLYL